MSFKNLHIQNGIPIATFLHFFLRAFSVSSFLIKADRAVRIVKYQSTIPKIFKSSLMKNSLLILGL